MPWHISNPGNSVSLLKSVASFQIGCFNEAITAEISSTRKITEPEAWAERGSEGQQVCNSNGHPDSSCI